MGHRNRHQAITSRISRRTITPMTWDRVGDIKPKNSHRGHREHRGGKGGASAFLSVFSVISVACSRFYCTGILYRKVIFNRTIGPLNSAGSGGKGEDAKMPDMAALSKGSEFDVLVRNRRGTTPSRWISNWISTLPRLPMRAISGITASQLRLI